MLSSEDDESLLSLLEDEGSLSLLLSSEDDESELSLSLSELLLSESEESESESVASPVDYESLHCQNG